MRCDRSSFQRTLSSIFSHYWNTQVSNLNVLCNSVKAIKAGQIGSSLSWSESQLQPVDETCDLVSGDVCHSAEGLCIEENLSSRIGQQPSNISISHYFTGIEENRWFVFGKSVWTYSSRRMHWSSATSRGEEKSVDCKRHNRKCEIHEYRSQSRIRPFEPCFASAATEQGFIWPRIIGQEMNSNLGEKKFRQLSVHVIEDEAARAERLYPFEFKWVLPSPCLKVTAWLYLMVSAQMDAETMCTLSWPPILAYFSKKRAWKPPSFVPIAEIEQSLTGNYGLDLQVTSVFC